MREFFLLFLALVTVKVTGLPSYTNLLDRTGRTAWRYTGCANMNFLRQGFQKLSSDRQTYTTEITHHAASRVVNKKLSCRK